MIATNGLFKFNKILESALHEVYNDENIELVKIDTNFNTSKGINFLSDFFKTTLRYKKAGKNGDSVENSVNVVVKSEPTNGQSALEIFREQSLFTTEWKMYRDILPKIEKLTSQKIAPKMLYGSEDLKTLVMEDISIQGFRMMDPHKRLSLKHCILVITKLAILHGASVALYEKNPELVKSVTGGIVSSKSPYSLLRLIEISLLNISREIRNWSSDGYLECSEKLEKLAERMKHQVIKDYDYDLDEFCVINHGDCWINNLMFKYNEKDEPIDVRLVDYQMSVYTSPAIDLHYFLSICPETALKYDKDDYLLNIYLNVLTKVMQSSGCATKPPTIEELKKSMHKRRSYAVFAGLVLFPRMIADKEDMEDFDEVLGRLNGETRMNIFKREDAVTAIRKMIIAMNERGYFD